MPPCFAGYHHFRKGLSSVGCSGASKVELILSELPIMEDYLKTHTKCNQAYYDYAMMLYIIALRDRGKSDVYLQKSLKAFDQFIALHPKNTYAGYWNKAILLAYNLYCAEALEQLNKAKQSCHDLDKLWDAVSEKNIRMTCGDSPSDH
jgi:hypothetical protein